MLSPVLIFRQKYRGIVYGFFLSAFTENIELLGCAQKLLWLYITKAWGDQNEEVFSWALCTQCTSVNP